MNKLQADEVQRCVLAWQMLTEWRDPEVCEAALTAITALHLACVKPDRLTDVRARMSKGLDDLVPKFRADLEPQEPHAEGCDCHEQAFEDPQQRDGS